MEHNKKKYDLKIGFWNVNGLNREKTSEECFQQHIQLFDIIFLLETWHEKGSADQLHHPPEYLYECVFRKHKKKKGRASGGILVYYKKEYKNILSFPFKNSSENILWIKIAKGFVHASKEVYVAGVYNSPKYSNYTKENNCNIIEILTEQLKIFSSSDIVFIGGDFNSRIGTQNDLILESEKDISYLTPDYEIDTTLPIRNNQDISVNEYGLQLIDLCISSKMRILNGRTRGDLQGHVTYIGHKGNSTVDLVLASEFCLSKTEMIQYLSVLDLSHLSDHCPILLKLSSLIPDTASKSNNQEKVIELNEKHPGYIWKHSLINNYSENLSQETLKIKNPNNEREPFNEIDNFLEQIQNAYISAAEKALKCKHPNNSKRKKRKNQHWFNLNCHQLQKNLNRLGRILTKNPKNHFVKEQYFQLKRKYRANCRKEKRKYERNLLQDLENMYTANKDEFWDLLQKIRVDLNNKDIGNNTLPTINDLDKHYKKLLQKDCSSSKQNTSEKSKTKTIESLNEKITLEEIKTSIKALKNQKSPGLDNITNEMIKCSNTLMIEHLESLFNKILELGYYPKSWNHGLICSIYKSGKKDDPNNYRGITLSNCLGKLFNTILYNRLQKETQANNILSPAQAGFRKDHRTSDHIFTLFTLIKKYIKKGKYLYTCFVDFRKAYDTINRNSLKHKLKKFGIEGKFLNIITSIYESTKVSLSYKKKISPPFITSIGLKQGDVLSTIFFNLFINDLPSILGNQSTHFDENETPEICKENVSSLLFADDLAMFSLTQKGLQNKLDILQNYCSQWDLNLNLKKTKIMIFNKQGATIKKFKFFFKGEEIDVVNQYTYLGFTFIPSGKKHVGIENLIKKGKKAWFSIQKMLNKSKEKTIGTYLKLIDSLVKPIILYACESWGDSLKKGVFSNKIEQFHISMCKQVMGVCKFTSNIKVLAELGRMPLKIDIETKMFKYLQRMPFIEKHRFLYKAFKEDESEKIGWVRNMKSVLDNLGLSNLMLNIFKTIDGVIPQEEYENKENFFKKRNTDQYYQTFYNYIDRTEDRGFFMRIKEKYEKERYLEINNIELRTALSKLRLSSYKLAVVTGKWNKTKLEDRKCQFCKSNEVEDEFHLLFQCSNYDNIRKELNDYLITNENIDITSENKFENLKLVFSNGSFRSLKALGKFVFEAFEKRNKS